MATNDVISELVRDLRPVRPLPVPRVRLARWAVIATGAAFVAVAALGIRRDVASALSSLTFQVHVFLLVVAAASSAGAALVLATPGESLGRRRRSLPVIAMAAWTAWLAAELMPFAAGGGQVWPMGSGWGCVMKAFAVGAAPGFALAFMLRRGAPGDVTGTATYAALAGAAVGALGVEVTCPLSNPMHLLLWHAGPALAVVIGVSLLCRGLLGAFERLPGARP